MDEEIRGTGNNKDTDSTASSAEKDWVIPELINTMLSESEPTPLDQQVTVDQKLKGKCS